MTQYNTKKDMFDNYNNDKSQTSYGPFIPGQNLQDSYHIQAQQESMRKFEYKKPFKTTHASRVDY